ncbi:hypothetical protein LUZ60_001449 [Juncus effusus]|nr:hypothetical protein LUZ60_001449 [Juncus effusus]
MPLIHPTLVSHNTSIIGFQYFSQTRYFNSRLTKSRISIPQFTTNRTFEFSHLSPLSSLSVHYSSSFLLHSKNPTAFEMTASFRRAIGQRFNPSGIFFTLSVAFRQPRLFLPHLSVRDISSVDWAALRRAGFRGVVLDKDNTLTAPYSLSLWPNLNDSLQQCLLAFPGQVAVFSNSAGLREYDPNGLEATKLEESIEGVSVIRHETKKPAGTVEEIEKFFGCSASHLLMVGDRNFTDVVYGNKNGFLTVLTEPLCLSKEPFIVQQVRRFERFLVNHWCKKGLKPVEHPLLSEARNCIQDNSL